MSIDEIGVFSPTEALRIWKATKEFERLGSGGTDTFVPIQDAPIYIKNDSGEVIPPYSIVQVTNTVEDGKNYLLVKKPTVTSTALTDQFLFSGPREIPIGGFSIAQTGPVFRVKKDGATLAAGMRLGPVNGQWTISKGAMFTYLGTDAIETDCVRLMSNDSLLLAVATSGIPARSGTTLGKAAVAVRHLTVSGSNRVIADSSYTVDAFNMAASAVNSGSYVLLKRLYDVFVVVWEEC